MSSGGIGGFFALELPDGKGRPVLSHWCGDRDAAFYGNARSALAALVEVQQPGSVWLPAYLCQSLADAVPSHLRRYYGVGTRFSPDLSSFEPRDGDMVVVINYFGFAPDAQFVRFARGKPNLLFLEDCAQCLDPPEAAWSDWRLFSPRKLLGVADGGILVAMRPGLRVPQPAAAHAAPERDWLPALLRFEDEPTQGRNAVWHQANQAREAAASVCREAVTRLTRALLERLPIDIRIARRAANFDRLRQRLADLMPTAFTSAPAAPFCFPVIVSADRRDRLLQQLHESGIFATVHWRDMPSPADTFPEEHRLAAQMISLPCDHRYGPAEMDRIADTVLRLAR